MTQPLIDPTCRYIRLRLDQLIIEDQVRKSIAPESLQELASSIKQHGLLQEPLVQPTEESGKYRVLSGHRRVLASRMIPLETIPCRLVEKSLSDEERSELQLTENLQREDLGVRDKAEGFRDLMQKRNWNQSELANHLSLSVSTVSRTLGFLKLPDGLQHRVEKEGLPLTTALEWAKLGVQAPKEQEFARLKLDQGPPTGNGTTGIPPAGTSTGGQRLSIRLEDHTLISLSNPAESLSWDHIILSLEKVLSKAKRARKQDKDWRELPTLLKPAKEQDKKEEKPPAGKVPAAQTRTASA